MVNRRLIGAKDSTLNGAEPTTVGSVIQPECDSAHSRRGTTLFRVRTPAGAEQSVDIVSACPGTVLPIQPVVLAVDARAHIRTRLHRRRYNIFHQAYLHSLCSGTLFHRPPCSVLFCCVPLLVYLLSPIRGNAATSVVI